MPATTTAYTSSCTLNGQPVDCAQLAHQAGVFFRWGLGGFVLLLVISILLTIFWIMMLSHAVKHPIEHKAIWIIFMLVTGAFGAIVYYFAVKRNFAPAPAPAAPMPPASVPPAQIPPVGPVI